MLKTIEDQYNGIIIDNTTLPDSKEDFHKSIKQLIASLNDKNLIWIKIPIEKADFISLLAQLDFEFHHCDEKNIMLIKKMKDNAIVPTTKNYIVGVGAIVINKSQLLVIKDRISPYYKLPGGHIDKNESLKDAIKREVYEETGIAIEFESIVGIGHFRRGQFGESNLHLVCTAKTLSYAININDTAEIMEAKWMEISDFLNSEEVTHYYKSIVRSAINNKDLKLQEQEVQLRFTGGEVFF